MSNIRLFRKEAVRHQFRSQEFGEAVIEQPRLLDKAIIYLGGGVLLMGLAAAAIPLSGVRAVALQPAMDNYQPVVMARPAVIAQQMLRNGARVMARQPVAKVRLFPESGESEITEWVHSPESGIYFPVKEQGTLTEPYQPIAYVLRENSDNQYGFWLQDAEQNKNILPGQPVRLVIGRTTMHAKIVEVSGHYSDGRQKLVIELLAGPDKAHLSPQAKVLLYGVEKSGNIFELLSKKP